MFIIWVIRENCFKSRLNRWWHIFWAIQSRSMINLFIILIINESIVLFEFTCTCERTSRNTSINLKDLIFALKQYLTIYLKIACWFVHEVKSIFVNQFIETMRLYVLSNESFRTKSKDFHLRFTILNIVKISLIENEKWNRHTTSFEFLNFLKQYVVEHFVCLWTRFNNFASSRRILLRWKNDLLHEWKEANDISSVELIIVACESQKIKNSSKHSKERAFSSQRNSWMWSLSRVCHSKRY